MILSSAILPNVTASESTAVQEDKQSTILDNLLLQIFEIPYILYENGILPPFKINRWFPWFIFRLQDPPFFSAKPGNIDLKYLNETEIIVGAPDIQNPDNWTTNFPVWPLADIDYFRFSIDLPEGIPEGSIDYRFYPSELLYPKKGVETKVTLKVITNFPTDSEIPDRFVLRVNITRYQIINNLLSNAFNMSQNQQQMGVIGGLLFALGFWPFISQVQGVNTQNILIDIVVKEDRYHLLQIMPPGKIEMAPNEIKSVPFNVKNLGSHTDVFIFNVKFPDNSELIITPPDSLTIDPNEEKTVYLGIATPKRFQDPGTLYDIKVEAVSIYDKNSSFENSIAIFTRGIYISESSFYYSLCIMPFLLMIFFYIYLNRKRKWKKVCIKPNKPWDLPEERKNLDELKNQKNKTKYDETMKRLEEEYKSSILWYKSYCKAIVEESSDKTSIFKTLGNLTKSSLGSIEKIFKSFKLKEKKSRKKPVKIKHEKRLKSEKKKEEKPSSEDIKPIHVETKDIKKPGTIQFVKSSFFKTVEKSVDNKEKLDSAIIKILNEQEKQKRKYKIQ